MLNTLEGCCDLVRDLLGDTDTPGGDVFSNEEQRQSFNSAWGELMAMLMSHQIPAVERIWFHNLAAETPVLFPIQAGISDMGEPSFLEERIPGVVLTITGVVAGAGGFIQITTSAAHGLTGNNEIAVSDVIGVPEANGRAIASVIDATNLLLNGTIFADTSTYVSGGSVTSSTDRFSEVRQVESLSDRDPDEKLHEFMWMGDYFQFVGATQALQLRIRHFSTGAPPTTGSLIYQDILNSLAYRTAALLAYKHGRGQDEGKRLDAEARGRDLDGNGGHYFLFLQPKVRQLQQTPLRRPVRVPKHLAEIYYPQ